MVTTVQAFQASDGSLHKTQYDAARQDARNQLKRLDIFNEATIQAVIKNADAICDALRPLLGDAKENA